MVSIPQRMRKLQTKLLAIRLGSGALILPKNVTRIHMRFAQKIEGGHQGPRQFWRHELVRLRYHNPTVPMTIDRTAAAAEPSVMSVHFAAASTSTAQPATSTLEDIEEVKTIDMKNRTNSEILERLVALTKAQVVEATAEEREELADLEEQRARSARDSKLSGEVRARQKREEQLLEQARGDMAQPS